MCVVSDLKTNSDIIDIRPNEIGTKFFTTDYEELKKFILKNKLWMILTNLNWLHHQYKTEELCDHCYHTNPR